MKNIINIFSLITLICFCNSKLMCQQLANSSHISETRTYWNPAVTSVGNDMIVDGFFRMQWLGFQGAPVSGFTSLQMPFVDMNMSAGAVIFIDKTGPISKTGLQLNYAYKLKQLIARYDQLSIGISGNMQQYSFNAGGQSFVDEGDNLLSNSNTSTAFPAFGTGIYYTSNTREYNGNTFFGGVAVNQIYSKDVIINSVNQQRKKHFHINAGGRFYSYDSYIEPMITANIVSPDIVDLLFGLKFEKENSFWAGLGYSGSGIAALQLGIIKDEFGDRYGKLKMGVLGNYGVSDGISQTGSGLEFYIAYHLAKK